jgi:hypothetical protein
MKFEFGWWFSNRKGLSFRWKIEAKRPYEQNYKNIHCKGRTLKGGDRCDPRTNKTSGVGGAWSSLGAGIRHNRYFASLNISY